MKLLHSKQNTLYPTKLTTESFERFADRVAFIYDKTEISYNQLSDMLATASQQLLQKNLQPGDHLLIYSPNPELTASVFLGALRIKVVPGIIPVGLNESQLDTILSEANAKLLLCDRNFIAQFRGIEKYGTKFLYQLPALDETIKPKSERLWGKHFLVFAGATCEYPHWLISSTRFLSPLSQAERARFNLAPNDKIFCGAGLSGVAALVNGFLCPLLCGITTVFANIWTSPTKITNIINQHKPRLMLANLSQYQAMLKNVPHNLLQEALSNTQYCIAIGEALDDETAKQWMKVTKLQLIEQPILLTGSRHADDLAYAAATDSHNENLLEQHQQESIWSRLLKK